MYFNDETRRTGEAGADQSFSRIIKFYITINIFTFLFLIDLISQLI